MSLSSSPSPAAVSGAPQEPWRRQLGEREAGLIDKMRTVLPGGCLGGNQLPEDVRFVFAQGEGARVRDLSGNDYIDYCLGSGALVLGHAHPAITAAVTQQIARGAHFFAYLNEPAAALAAKLVQYGACVDRVRFTTSGSEATFHAIRLARAFTGRDKIIKFEGAYHGNHDYAQISVAPKRGENWPGGIPDTAGIPQVVRDLALVAPYNDLDAVRSIVARHGKEIAAIIVEPIQRIISPQPGFLQGLREITQANGILLILDEVVTGFRYGLTGAQGYFDVVPDLATYGKILGGTLPVGAIGGRADVMDQCDPTNKGKTGYVYQNGTLNGNPLGCAAGLAAIGELEKAGTYDRLFRTAQELRDGLNAVLRRRGVDAIVFGEGPMWHLLFTDKPPVNWRDVITADSAKLAAFDAELIRNGLWVLPANRRFVSTAHRPADLEDTFVRFDAACRSFDR